MWRAQYNAVTEIHIHTPKGGTFPFTAISGFQRWHNNLAPFPVWQDTNAPMYTFNHPFIYTSLSVENQPYEQSAQYLGNLIRIESRFCDSCIAKNGHS